MFRGLSDSTGVPLVDEALNYVHATAQVDATSTAMTKLKPYLVLSIILGVVGAALGFAAFTKARKRTA